MTFSLKNLEYHKILNLISNYAHTQSGFETIQKLEPTADFKLCQMWLLETEEMRKCLVFFKQLPIFEDEDLRPIIQKINQNGIFNSKELPHIRSFLSSLTEIKEFYLNSVKNKFEFSYLKNYFLKIDPLNNIQKAINAICELNGEIKDSASQKLFNIRSKIREQEKKLRLKMQELMIVYKDKLAENLIVIRRNKMCLAVKDIYYKTVKGFIHDKSQSNSTFYIEPYSCMPISQEISLLEEEEINEIQFILKKISAEICDKNIIISDNFAIFISLDILNAKASYALEIDGVLPLLNQEKIIDLKKAYHPLIDAKKMVPLTFSIKDNIQTMIITGANTGGKTVVLKTAGLLSLMLQSGILIPCDANSNMAIFDHIFADIGDDQSIENALSSFSSHILNIKNILINLTPNSLLILDELCMGTDPIEGANLAIALIEYFMQQGAIIISSTHYQNLKAYAYLHHNIMVSKMEFDYETLKPTYRIITNSLGNSNALLIAQKLGIPESIINNATNLVKDNSKLDQLLVKIEHEEQLLTEKERLVDVEKNNLDQMLKDIVRRENVVKEKEEKIINLASQKAEEILMAAQVKATELLDEITKLKDKSLKEHEIADLKYQIRSINQISEEEISKETFQKGDMVLVLSFNRAGIINKVLKDKYEVNLDNLTIITSASDLKLTTLKKSTTKVVTKQVEITPKQVHNTLDLRGYYFHEVAEALDKFIDDAIIGNLNQLTIIHGFGKGAVRKAVYDYLKKSAHIASYRYGGENEGLNGVTIITLK